MTHEDFEEARIRGTDEEYIKVATRYVQILEDRIAELLRPDCKTCFYYGRNDICNKCKHYLTSQYEEENITDTYYEPKDNK